MTDINVTIAPSPTYRFDTRVLAARLMETASQTFSVRDDGMAARAVGAPDIHDHAVACRAEDGGRAAEVAQPLKTAGKPKRLSDEPELVRRGETKPSSGIPSPQADAESGAETPEP
ncbi:hypothetical protein GCM10010176_022850 [Nonomuraea spiralis]|nr:hypothetical protein GCM10010176_022850 [Nonomuraea spiralis]